jgi:hypothetical protein
MATRKKNDHCKEHVEIIKKSKCYIGTHLEEGTVFQQPGGLEVTYFEDLTDNHNKMMVTLENISDCPMTLTIETRDYNNTIEKVIPPSSSRSVQAEDVKKLSIRCDCPTTPGFCLGVLSWQKTFCICCKGEGQRHNNHCS